MQMLGSRSGGSERMAPPEDDAPRAAAAPARKSAGAGAAKGSSLEDLEDDIPF